MTIEHFRTSRMVCFFASVASLAFVFTTGCEKESDVGGPGGAAAGSGYSNRDSANDDNTFVLTVPSGQVDIYRGESKAVTIGIERGAAFTQAVEVSITAAAQGFSAEPAKTSLAAGQTEVEIILKAAADAPLGVTNVTVVGKPQTGESVNTNIEVEINER